MVRNGGAAVFGTPGGTILAELAIEAFFPADAEIGDILRRLAAQDQ